MRTIRLKDESNDGTLLWVLAGTAIGVLAGILVAERMSGRKLTARGLLARGKRLAALAMARGEELIDAASQLREAWGAADAPRGVADDFAEAEFADDDEDGDENGFDDALDSELDDEDGDATDGADNEDPPLDERVLEAFVNDPVLVNRAIEIEAEDGSILLHGRVRSAREVQHAVTIARGVPGVAEVRQRLRVTAHR